MPRPSAPRAPVIPPKSAKPTVAAACHAMWNKASSPASHDMKK